MVSSTAKHCTHARHSTSSPRLHFYYPPTSNSLLQIKQLLNLGHGIVRPRHRVANRPAVLVDLVVVAARKRLVAKEVDRRVVRAVGPLALVLDVLQAVRLVPAVGEDVKGDLPADGEAVGSEGC